MKKYIGLKVVLAEPKTYKEAGKAGLVRGFDPDKEDETAAHLGVLKPLDEIDTLL